MELATFGNGCFWCTEAVFQHLKGVNKVASGYTGGQKQDPTYKEVCSGNTGHAEVIQLTFDPSVITYDELLEVFWQTHDPTTLNRQGSDTGTQYRSVVFYHNEAQKQLATVYKAKLDASDIWNAPIVTEVTEFDQLYVAENHHQDYFNLNRSQPYCDLVIRPKVEKFKTVFKNKLKELV